MRKVYCSVCCKQLVNANTNMNDQYTTTVIGARADFSGAICGHCAKELDSNGLFPEERMSLGLPPFEGE